MSDSTPSPADVPAWNPEAIASFLARIRPLIKLWHRSQVHGLEHVPDGGALIVSNHSGGVFTMDFPVFLIDWCAHFGTGRPVYLLSHAVLFKTPFADWLRGIGLIPASREAAQTVLGSGNAVIVFPGGDYDVSRPSTQANTIDFAGRTGYVTTALDANVPIVPMVSIGGHENQLYLARGTALARALRLPKLTRMAVLPISVGFPWGASLMSLPPNIPLPTKIVTQVLEPVNVRAEFGDSPDAGVVDAHVRKLMQAALDELARQRRFPIVG